MDIKGKVTAENIASASGEFTADVSIKGKSTLEGDVEVRGKALNMGGEQFQLGMFDSKSQMDKRENRALFHHTTPTDSLHLNYDGDFEGGVVVGGPRTQIQGTLVSDGDVIAKKTLNVKGDTIRIGQNDGKKQGSNGKNRAIAHGDQIDHLIVNQEGDFEGGVLVEGKGLFTQGKIGVGAGNLDPEADVHIKTAGTDAQLMFSHATKTKNKLFMKAKSASGNGLDMEIGSTAGSTDYGKLVMNFGGDITFMGGGATNFQRGDLNVVSGKVGIGDSASGPHGLTVQTGEKAGHESNDVNLKKGSLHVFGGIFDTSSAGGWNLDLDKGGYIKAVNVASAIGIGTQQPASPFGDTNAAVLHMVDAQRPAFTLESQADNGHSTITMKTGTSTWSIDQTGTKMSMSSSGKDLLVLDNKGKVGIGRENAGDYGVNVHLVDGVDNSLNDVAIPHGNLRLKGKIYDTFDGGDKFYLDPSGLSNIKDASLEGKLSFAGVSAPAQFHIDVPAGEAHISLGRSLFLNGFGEETARVTNNGVTDNKGAWKLHDPTKFASAMELRNNGQIEFKASTAAGKTTMQSLLAMDSAKKTTFTGPGVLFGAGHQEPEHTFHMPGDEHQMSLGNNMFLSGGDGTASTIAANAYKKQKAWVIPRNDRMASTIELKDAGGIDMYGTAAPGAVQFVKMFGFNAPAKKVYALGKLGVETENPTHTLTIPSGEHHISLGDKMFLNGAGATTRIMGNAVLSLGKLAPVDKDRQALSLDFETATGKMSFGGTQSKGADSFLKLLSLDFTNKVASIDSGRLGVRTPTPKTAFDVRGHINMQDPSNAGVIYTPASGAGLFLRSSDTPGTYVSSQERFFFGNNRRAGFGTVQPDAKLHIVHEGDETLPHLTLETKGNLAYSIGATAANGLLFETKLDGSSFAFKAAEATPLVMTGKSGELESNGVKYTSSTAVFMPGGGRVAVGAAPEGQHNLQVTGPGILLAGAKNSVASGALAFANDGGGNGFMFDYDKGLMKFGSLGPSEHLKITAEQTTFMAITDTGRVGIGTNEPSGALNIKSDDGLVIENAAGLKWTLKADKNGHLQAMSSSGGYFIVDKEGGVRSTEEISPYKMVVDGTGLLMDGGSKGDAPLVFTANGGGKGFQMKYNKEHMYFGRGDGDKNHFVVSDDGWVGVGVDSASHGIHLKHNTGMAIENGDKAEKWNMATDQAGMLTFRQGADDKVHFTKGGFVGINTAKPKKHLHVEGDAFIAGKMHVDNYYLKKKAAALVVNQPAPALERLTSEEALIQLDEHVSAKMDDGNYGMVHRPGHKLENEAVDYASMMTVMHRVMQEQQATIAKLSERVAALEKTQK